MSESLESVEFEPLQEVQLELKEGELEGTYRTYVDSIGQTELELRVPILNRIYLPVRDGSMITFRTNTVSASYESRMRVEERDESGTYPSIFIPRPAKMKRIQNRDHLRVPCEIPVDLWELKKDTESIKRGPLDVTALDISAGGMKIVSREFLSEGSEVVLNFELSLINKQFETVFGRILRNLDETTDGRYVNALQFSGLPKHIQESILQFTYRRQIQLKRRGKLNRE